MWYSGVSGRGRPVIWYSGQCVMCGIVAWMSAQFGIVCGKCTLWCNALCGQQYGQCVMLWYIVAIGQQCE